MRRSWTPSIVPKGDDQNVYLVVDHLGRMAGSIGKPTPRPPIWKSSSSTCLRGNTKGPVRVVAFNTLEHWSEDVSKDLAREIQTRCDIEARMSLNRSGTLSTPTPVRIDSSRCGWHTHE